MMKADPQPQPPACTLQLAKKSLDNPCECRDMPSMSATSARHRAQISRLCRYVHCGCVLRLCFQALMHVQLTLHVYATNVLVLCTRLGRLLHASWSWAALAEVHASRGCTAPISTLDVYL